MLELTDSVTSPGFDRVVVEGLTVSPAEGIVVRTVEAP